MNKCEVYISYIAKIHEFPSISIDFIIYFAQDDLDVDIFMENLLVMGVDGNIVEWVLKLNKLFYGLKQSSSKWFDLLKTGLESRGCPKYQVEPCMFYRKDSVSLPHVDDCIIVSHKEDTITSIIRSLSMGLGIIC